MPKKNVEKKLFTLEELKPAKHYRIKVKSFNKDKKLTGESPWIIFETAGKSNAPPDVTNLEGDFRGTQLVVKWDAPWKDSVRDFKDFVVKIESPGVSQEKNFAVLDEKFTFSADQNRNLFNSFRGVIKVTVYSRDRSDNKSNGVSITATAQVPENPTNVKLTAATLGYNVSWDLPLFDNYDYTRIYESSTQNGTYSVVRTERGSSTYVPRNNFNEVWVKVSHVNKAGVESNLVASVPPSIIPIDPVPVDVNPPNIPTNLNWEDPEINALDSTGGITTASKRAHWQVSDIASGYKVRVSENQQNWAVYDVPASRASVTFKQASGTTATLTVTAHSFSQYDYITVFNVGAPFDGKFKVTATTATTISYTLPSASTISQTAANGTAVISSYTVKELTPGTTYYGSILAYDGANNLTQFVSDGQFTTTGTAGQVGSALTIAGTSMKFGPAAGGAGNNGLFINSSNYWYSTGTFNVGTTNNSVSWDGVRLRLDGALLARSGSFSGNVFISGSGTDSGSLIASNPFNIQTASWSSGIGTIITTTTPSPTWQVGDIIVISQSSSSFDGQYTLLSASGNTFTFSMTNSAQTTINTGLVVNVTRGNRTVFNSQGIQSFKDNKTLFSLNSDTPSAIAGWTITNDRIFSGSTTDYVAVSSSESSGWRIWAGSSTPSTAPFRVNSSGQIRGYGLFSSRDTDSGTRVSIGSNVSGTRDGILLEDTDIGGFENFWYVPSKVTSGNPFFRIGSSTASGITVIRTANNTPRVKIKDYDIEGVTSIVDDSKITVNTVEIGKGVGGVGRHGIKIDNSNYWYDPSPLSSSDIVFRAGGSATKSLTVFKNGEVEFEGTTNPTGGTIKGMLQTTNGFRIGKDVVSTKDGIFLNANNFWYIGNTVGQEFKLGSASRYLQFNSSNGVLELVGGSLRTSDSNSRVEMNSNGLYGYKFANNVQTTTFSIDAATGNAEFAGKIKKDATIGTTRIGIRDDSVGDTYPGIDVGSTLSINSTIDGTSSTASIIFVRTGTTIVEGSIFPLTASKTASTEYGLGIGVANAYPVMEVGWTDSARTSPRIRLSGGATSRLEVGASRFVLEGGNTSRIIIPVITGTATKYLGRINGNNEISWVDAPSGTGGKTYSSGDSDTGIIVNNTSDTITNAGYRMGGATSGVGDGRVSTRNRITFGATLPGSAQDGDIHIEF